MVLATMIMGLEAVIQGGGYLESIEMDCLEAINLVNGGRAVLC